MSWEMSATASLRDAWGKWGVTRGSQNICQRFERSKPTTNVTSTAFKA
jgi:hypothetical protein